MKTEEHRWYHADKQDAGRLTKKRRRGYVKPVKVKHPEKYLNSGAKR